MKRRLARTALLAAAAVLLGAVAGPAHAQSLAANFTSVTTDYTNGSWNLGWEFNVLQPIFVNSLAFYDDGMNGLTENHDVGIWDPSGNLLGSATVTNSDPLTGFFRTHGVTPFLLAVGNGYRVAGVSGSENYTWAPNGFSTIPEVQFVQDRWTLSTSLVYPTDSNDGADGAAFFGGNFGTTSTPEPASLVLMASGLLLAGGVVGWRRRPLLY